MDRSKIRFLIDTNILIYMLDGDPAALAFVEKHLHQSAITPVIYIETLGYPFSSREEEASVRELLDQMPLLAIDHEVMEQTIRIRRQSRVKLPDATIAATAQVHELTLVTRNLRDFQHLANLKLHNPFDHV